MMLGVGFAPRRRIQRLILRTWDAIPHGVDVLRYGPGASVKIVYSRKPSR